MDGGTLCVRLIQRSKSSMTSPRTIRGLDNYGGVFVVLILALLLVLILFGAGFAVHILWVAAAVFLVLWLVGFAIGRGEGAGTHRFYRW